MDTNHSLLSGVLALQIDLIDEQQFVEACRRWTAETGAALTDILIESSHEMTNPKSIVSWNGD